MCVLQSCPFLCNMACTYKLVAAAKNAAKVRLHGIGGATTPAFPSDEAL